MANWRKQMQNVNVFIRENVKNIGSGVYVTPNIPEKKLNNAIKAMHCESFYQSIIAIQDGTVFGSSDEGFVFTGERFVHHKYGEFLYSEIKSVKYEKDSERLIINKNGKNYKFEYLYDVKKEKFAEFLNDILSQFDNFKEEDQLKTISEMSDEFKIAYLKIIINMTYIDDKEIDEKELAEIFLLMTRLELSDEARFKVRAYIVDISKDNIELVSDLIEILKNNSEISHYKSIIISLIKDMINVHFSTKNTMTRDFQFLKDHSDLFGLDDQEVDLAYSTVENDYKMLNENLDNKTIEKNIKELGAKAAAAGAPLAAIYISGSVVGMSAAGITSGLATLGLGLGMTGGIAAVALIGVGAYKGVKYITGADEIDQHKTRELMLYDVIKQTHKTISVIIDDVNFIVKKLNNALLNYANQGEKIKRLSKMVAQFQGAAKSIDMKADKYQNSANRIKCPKELDLSRLRSMTDEPTKKPLYDFIIENYEEKATKEEGEMKIRYTLKDDVNTEVLNKMADIFKMIEYFDITNILKNKATSFFK